MEIQVKYSNDVPDSTYFTTGECEPRLVEDALICYDGKGSKRGWGAPGVTSTVVFQSTDLIAVHVGFHHKHGGGQFYRYFAVNGEVKQIEWKSLDDDTRAAVLEAYEKNAPNWAKTPGKLRSQYQTAQPKANLFTAYKIVRVEDDKFISLYDKTTTYEIGKTKVQASKPDHEGGWYVYRTEEVKAEYLAGNIINTPKSGKKALIKCECWGNRVGYDNGKISVTYCKPVGVIEVFEVE